jgi:hypothetical protein
MDASLLGINEVAYVLLTVRELARGVSETAYACFRGEGRQLR